METQGSQIFHKLFPMLNPSKLEKVLKNSHRGRIDKTLKHKSHKIWICHPSPSSFACIDMVFGLSGNWSPFFNESVFLHLNHLTELLAKGFLIYCLFDICYQFPVINQYKEVLEKIKQNSNDDDTHAAADDLRHRYIRKVAKEYDAIFSELKIHETLVKLRKTFETCVRWQIALGFIPVLQLENGNLKQEMSQWALKHLRKCKNKGDFVQEYIAAFFACLEYGLKKNNVMKPVDVKHSIIITSQDGWYNATTYDGVDIELLSFDNIQPDLTSMRNSPAGEMLSHEYLYLFAHDTNAIQTAKKLSQSTVVVSSEPTFSLNVNKSRTEDKMNENNIEINSLHDLKKLYEQMSEQCRKKLEYNPTATMLLESEKHTVDKTKAWQELFKKLKHTAEIANITEKEEITCIPETPITSTGIMDIYDDPKTNMQKSIETLQQIDKRASQEQMQRDLRDSIRTINVLQTNLKKHVEQNAIDNLSILILKEQTGEQRKNINQLEKELEKSLKVKENLQVQVDNMMAMMQELTAHIGTSEKQRDHLVNLFVKGKSIINQCQTSEADIAWEMNPARRHEVVSFFLRLLSMGSEHSCSQDSDPNSIRKDFQCLVLKMKMEVVPLFKNMRNIQQLDLYNSWVPMDMRDMCSSVISDTDTGKHKPDSNIIQVYETSSLKVIDVNPITVEEQDRIRKLAEHTSVEPILSGTGPGGSLFSKKFFNIQFPQVGNVEGAIDRGLKETWTQMMKVIFKLGPPHYTVTGQEIMPCPSQQTYEQFVIPFMTFLIGSDDHVRETVALLMKIENKEMFQQGAKDLTTFMYYDLFYFFWDTML